MIDSKKTPPTLAQLRIKRGLTQLQLAVLVGVTPNTIQGWEKNGLPHLSKYLRLAEVLGCKLEQLDAAEDQGLFDPDELASKFGLDDDDDDPHQGLSALPVLPRRRGRPPKERKPLDPDELVSNLGLDDDDDGSTKKQASLPVSARQKRLPRRS